MRDKATTEEILSLLRELLARDPGITFGQLVFSAAKFAVPEHEVLNISDQTMLRTLRARCYHNKMRPMLTAAVSSEHLAALDEAQDENNTHATEWLCKELAMIREWLVRGEAVEIADGIDNLTSLSAFDAWCCERYPSATKVSRKG